jgi:hypothetical protein
MLVIITDKHLLSPQEVCKGCLLATVEGLPRWRQGQLECGQHLEKSHQNRTMLYKCQMGFSLINVE